MSLAFIRPSVSRSRHCYQFVWSRAALNGCRKPNLILSAGAHTKYVPLEPMPDPPKAPNPEHISNFQWDQVVQSDLKTSDHCLYWDTRAPTKKQLAWADAFFRSTEHTSRRLHPSRAYHQLEKPTVPEIVLMSGSNRDKQLTLNWIFEQYLATSKAVPGRKFKLFPYAIGWQESKGFKAIIVDTPGLSSKNSDERAQMFARYMMKKREPYVFLTINAKRGPRMQDLECLDRLRRFSIPHQIVLNSADYVLRGSCEGKAVPENQKYCEEGFRNLKKRIKELKDIVQPPDLKEGQLPGKGEIIAYGATQHGAFGISHLRWAILQAVGLDKLYETKASKEINSKVSKEKDLKASKANGYGMNQKRIRKPPVQSRL